MDDPNATKPVDPMAGQTMGGTSDAGANQPADTGTPTMGGDTGAAGSMGSTPSMPTDTGAGAQPQGTAQEPPAVAPDAPETPAADGGASGGSQTPPATTPPPTV